MKLGNGILKSTVQQLSDENFHFYNSLVLTYDLAFQRTHFRITPPPTSHVSTTMMRQQTTTTICHYNTDHNYRIMNL
jgi:hypothetical protein